MGELRWGTHEEFTELYELFLDRAYLATLSPGDSIFGRCRLINAVDRAIRERRATRVLDCSAGTGFPGLNLAAQVDQDLIIHLSDGDPAMVSILARRALEAGIKPDELAPPRMEGRTWPTGEGSMVLNWSQLGHCSEQYDYVLCRGNSLAYADTWSGEHLTATDTILQSYVERMADRLRPGGYLHLDAPWKTGLDETTYVDRKTERGSTWEKVTVDRGRREWRLAFKPGGDKPGVRFKRYSSLLDIEAVSALLRWMGFGETQPFQLDGERKIFGTIIARKPKTGLTPLRRRRRRPQITGSAQ